MKKTKILTAMVALVAAFSLSSCLSSSNDENTQWTAPTPNEAYNMFLKVGGPSEGKIGTYEKNAQTSKYEEKYYDASCYITGRDSIATISFPTKALANNIKNNEELKAALTSAPNQTIKCMLIPYDYESTLFVANSNLYDKNNKVVYNEFTLSYGEPAQSHKITLKFYNNYSMAGYPTSGNTTSKYFRIEFNLAELDVDGQEVDLATNKIISSGYSTYNSVYFYFTQDTSAGSNSDNNTNNN